MTHRHPLGIGANNNLSRDSKLSEKRFEKWNCSRFVSDHLERNRWGRWIADHSRITTELLTHLLRAPSKNRFSKETNGLFSTSLISFASRMRQSAARTPSAQISSPELARRSLSS